MKIGVMGAGGWGTSISTVLADNGHQVCLWAFEKELADEINENRSNSMYLPSAKIPEGVCAVNDMNKLSEYDVIFLTVPTKFINKTFDALNFSFESKYLINGAKGIESDSLKRISQISFEKLNLKEDNYAVITGPSHAEEVVKRMPTTVVTASSSNKTAQMVQDLLNNDVFRVYTSKDVTGCELGGALKNIIAIAAGIIDGLEMGDNTKAALITRGLAEMTRLGSALGAKPLTFSGLSGLGDLVVTCSSKHSRNRYLGEQIGKGISAREVSKQMKMIAEGVNTTKSAYKLGKKLSVEMPICEQMYEILFNDKNPRSALQDLMNRSSKSEWWW